MKSYTNYKENLAGYQDVLLTVQTTQKVAAHNLLKEYDRIKLLQRHELFLQTLTDNFEKAYPLSSQALIKNGKGGKLLIIIAGDRGLCGDLYLKLAKTAKAQAGYKELILLGQTASKYLDEEGVSIKDRFDLEEASVVFDYFYNQFKNNLVQIDLLFAEPQTLSHTVPKLINLLSPQTTQKESGQPENYGFPILGSPKEELIDFIIRERLSLNFQVSLIKAAISEFSSRIVAMEHAEGETEKIKTKLKLDYFKNRRVFATERQLEGFVSHIKA